MSNNYIYKFLICPLAFFIYYTQIQAGTPAFQNIDSSQLERIDIERNLFCREDFFGISEEYPPPLIGKSNFISKEMVEHLMRHKKNRAIGKKYVIGDEITNMEGALHTFVTPVCAILMTGDYKWVGQLQGEAFGNNQVRKTILSAAIHPDFEFDTVIMQLIMIRDEAIIGESLDLKIIPSAEQKQSKDFRASYDEKLRKHMVYHLTSDHRLPALHEISPEQIMNQEQAQFYIEYLIQNPQGDLNLKNKFLRVGNSIVSLEILSQIYVEQIRNEFKILNSNTPQGYVYTISPPSIFSRWMGGATILNRLQALAFRTLASENLFSNMKVLGFGDYIDKGMVPLLSKALPGVKVVSQSDLCGPKGLALVLHNNSDAFGQNIETEGPTSLDGVIGSFSNAASVLNRNRPDLVDFIF